MPLRPEYLLCFSEQNPLKCKDVKGEELFIRKRRYVLGLFFGRFARIMFKYNNYLSPLF